MATIFFSSHQEKTYNVEAWRHIFSQWYCSGKSFVGGDSVYDLEEFISEEDWTNLVLNQEFWLREQWMMYIKALVFAKGEHSKTNLGN